MKSITRALAIVVPACFVVASLALPAAAQDKAKPAAAKADEKKAAQPSNRKVLFENDKVLVYETTTKAGESTSARERPPRVARALTSGTTMRTYPDGKTEKVEWKAGDVRWLPKENFANKNIGKSDFVLYIVQPT